MSYRYHKAINYGLKLRLFLELWSDLFETGEGWTWQPRWNQIDPSHDSWDSFNAELKYRGWIP